MSRFYAEPVRMSQGVEWALHVLLTFAWLEDDEPVSTAQLAARRAWWVPPRARPGRDHADGCRRGDRGPAGGVPLHGHPREGDGRSHAAQRVLRALRRARVHAAGGAGVASRAGRADGR